MTRTARCQCGQLRLSCKGEPDPVIMCSCQLCQRRTGSPIHIGAWFEEDKVTFAGESKQFTRNNGDLGMEVTFNFCPECGTTVWWPSLRRVGPMAGKIGIAGGCFADKDFPSPTMSVYEKHRHPWIHVPEGIPRFEAGIVAPDSSE